MACRYMPLAGPWPLLAYYDQRTRPTPDLVTHVTRPLPTLATASLLAPASSSCRTTSAWPLYAALWSGVCRFCGMMGPGPQHRAALYICVRVQARQACQAPLIGQLRTRGGAQLAGGACLRPTQGKGAGRPRHAFVRVFRCARANTFVCVTHTTHTRCHLVNLKVSVACIGFLLGSATGVTGASQPG